MSKLSQGWYVHNDSDLVIVFVHGLFSDFELCWLNEIHQTYWPKLIEKDERFNRVCSIFSGKELMKRPVRSRMQGVVGRGWV